MSHPPLTANHSRLDFPRYTLHTTSPPITTTLPIHMLLNPILALN